MIIRVVHRDGAQELLTVVGPILQITETLRDDGMGSFRDATGTDYYFNESDGTFDGWGQSCPPEMTEKDMDETVERIQAAREVVSPIRPPLLNES